jgi:uncharacterized protein YndB with AHSA1/START domain
MSTIQSLHWRLATLLAASVVLGHAAAADTTPDANSVTERALHKEVTVNAPVDAVWEAWTTSGGIATFFAPAANVEARVGGPFEVYMNPYAEPGMRGADGMQILALQPKRMLSFTWNAPPHLPEARAQRTFVVVRLVPKGDKETLVAVHHTGWGDGGEWDKAFDYFDKSWPIVLNNLKTRFDKGPIDFSGWLKQLKEMTEKAAQKK